jgi:hypothetical protein
MPSKDATLWALLHTESTDELRRQLTMLRLLQSNVEVRDNLLSLCSVQALGDAIDYELDLRDEQLSLEA